MMNRPLVATGIISIFIAAGCRDTATASNAGRFMTPESIRCAPVVYMLDDLLDALEREDWDPHAKGPCVSEMVYAALRRAGYLVYFMNDLMYPEVQPYTNLYASTRVQRDPKTGDLVAEFDAGLEHRKVRTQIRLKSGTFPTQAEIEQLIRDAFNAPMLSADMAALRADPSRCVDPKRYITPREPKVADSCDQSRTRSLDMQGNPVPFP